MCVFDFLLLLKNIEFTFIDVMNIYLKFELPLCSYCFDEVSLYNFTILNIKICMKTKQWKFVVFFFRWSHNHFGFLYVKKFESFNSQFNVSETLSGFCHSYLPVLYISCFVHNQQCWINTYFKWISYFVCFFFSFCSIDLNYFGIDISYCRKLWRGFDKRNNNFGWISIICCQHGCWRGAERWK